MHSSIREKLNSLHIAAIFTVAALFIFSLLFGAFSDDGRQSCSFSEFKNRKVLPLPVPENPSSWQSIAAGSRLPALNSAREENLSRPPLSRACGVCFARKYSELKVIFRTNINSAAIFIHQKYIKSSIPVRAGPSCC